MKSRIVAILATPGFQLLDVSGAADVFAKANVHAGTDVYQLRVFGSVPGAIRSASGVRLMTDAVIGNDLTEKLDTLLVTGAPNLTEASLDARLVDWLREITPAVRRCGSIGSGAFLLAKADVLDGQRIQVDLAVSDRLATACESASMDSEAGQLINRRLRTAPQMTAALELCLALVEEDLGQELAMKVAEQLVMFCEKLGTQLQFSPKGEAVPVGRSALQQAQRWIVANLAEDLSIANLASRSGLSARHFARLFRQKIGVTPATWIKEARVAAACHLLEFEDAVPKQVAARCGFANADTLRRVFVRLVGVTPAEYRKRYQADAPVIRKPIQLTV